MCQAEQTILVQGRALRPSDLAQISQLVVAHPDWSRWRLSRELAAEWNWRNPAGQLKDMAARSLLVKLAQRSVLGRTRDTGARCPGDIGFAALRGGSVVGDHSVIFAGTAERLELVHRAEDRIIFARGALRAALWARGQKPGLYSMADVLGLNDV